MQMKSQGRHEGYGPAPEGEQGDKIEKKHSRDREDPFRETDGIDRSVTESEGHGVDEVNQGRLVVEDVPVKDFAGKEMAGARCENAGIDSVSHPGDVVDGPPRQAGKNQQDRELGAGPHPCRQDCAPRNRAGTMASNGKDLLPFSSGRRAIDSEIRDQACVFPQPPRDGYLRGRLSSIRTGTSTIIPPMYQQRRTSSVWKISSVVIATEHILLAHEVSMLFSPCVSLPG